MAAWLLAVAVLSGQHAPPLTPDEALASFRLAEGFQIELFAAEPLVSDPVAMEVDEDGRLFVVEMHGYPLDVSGSGRIVVLSDSNGDGKPDTSRVFADGLRLPTGIMRWKRGVLVTDSPDLLYLEDTDRDGRADLKRVVLTGFALTNPQHTTNTPIYGLDNWIYVANEGPVRTVRYQSVFGDIGTEVRYPERPTGPHLPPDGDGRNVRLKPDTFELEALASRSQFGQTFDAWGRQFLNTNSRHLYQEVVAARYASRNPSLLVSNVVEQVPEYRLPAELFPITANPEYQLLTDVGVMTAASGVTYYLADLFPARYRSATFVAESAHNLVRVDAIRDEGVTFRASRMFDGREFLASTDSWFRPVNFYIGPDGALYVIDYYRKIIEHPEWLDDATANSPDLYAGRDRGRIYRLVPAGTPGASWLNRVRLGAASNGELVRTLGHANIWWRRHAQRLLVDRKPAEAAAALADLATKGTSAIGRVHALWTLDGIHAPQTDTLAAALRDPSAGVRENAIRIAERHLDRAALRDRLLQMGDDPEIKVRFQLLLTLGEIEGPAAATLRNRLLLEHVEDGWMQIAALSARTVDGAAVFRVARERLSDRETPGRRTLFNRVAAMAGRSSNVSAAREIVREVLAAPSSMSQDWWRAAALDGLAEGVRGSKGREDALSPERAALASLVVRGAARPVRQGALHLLEGLVAKPGSVDAPVVRETERLAADARVADELRADAVHLLAVLDGAQYASLFRNLLGAGEPTIVQAAAVRALAALDDPRVAHDFIEAWDRWTPGVRDEAVRGLVRNAARIKALLDAVAAGRIRPSEIDRPLRVRLMMQNDETLRHRARALFDASAASPGAAVERYQAALSRPGNGARGREVFDRACAVCHQYRGSGGARFGPDLGEVRSHAPASLLVDILDPNHSIADGYELWVLKLTDGTTLTGIVGEEAPASLTLRLPGGAERVVPRAAIETMRIADTSAMPEALDGQIDVQQMADLLAFLRGGT